MISFGFTETSVSAITVLETPEGAQLRRRNQRQITKTATQRLEFEFKRKKEGLEGEIIQKEGKGLGIVSWAYIYIIFNFLRSTALKGEMIWAYFCRQCWEKPEGKGDSRGRERIKIIKHSGNQGKSL